MKPKLITIALLIVFSFTAKSQSQTFEQTVEYINDVVKSNRIHYKNGTGDCCSNLINLAKIKKSGEISFYYQSSDKYETPYGSFNVFDLEGARWSADYIYLYLNTKSNVQLCYFYGLSKSDGDRLYKAIWHLKNVCTKALDPFGN